MAEQTDSLISIKGPDRVNYQTGVLLNAEDFVAEQNYHRGRLARALAYVNGSGTLAGLEVHHEAAQEASSEQSATPEKLLIDPGLAIDRLGRLIEVPRALCLRLDKWYLQQDVADLTQAWNPADTLFPGSVAGVCVDVFIRFVACERGKTPTFNCGPFDSIDAVTADRIRDGYETLLLLRKEAAPGLPVSPWPDLSSLATSERPGNVREAIFAAWQSQLTLSGDNFDELSPLPEHAQGQDTTFLLLARLVIPADESTAGERPQRRISEAVQLRNDIRSFVITANALARLLGFNINEAG